MIQTPTTYFYLNVKLEYINLLLEMHFRYINLLVTYGQSDKKEQKTVIGCGNAIGHSIPPMGIFEGNT